MTPLFFMKQIWKSCKKYFQYVAKYMYPANTQVLVMGSEYEYAHAQENVLTM